MAGIWFAVGRPHGHRSAVWQLWTRGGAAYLLHSGTQGSNHRYSFSQSNMGCRWTELSPLRPRARTTILEWTRDPVPPRGSGLGCLLMAVIFPTSHLAPADMPVSDTVHWIDPAPPRWAVRLEFIFAHQPQPAAGNPAAPSPDRQLLFSVPLRNGLSVCAIKSVFDCGPVELKLPQRPSVAGQALSDIHFPESGGHNTERPIRVVLVGDEVQPPNIWELAGYEAHR